jgi:hypothetical protein
VTARGNVLVGRYSPTLSVEHLCLKVMWHLLDCNTPINNICTHGFTVGFAFIDSTTQSSRL